MMIIYQIEFDLVLKRQRRRIVIIILQHLLVNNKQQFISQYLQTIQMIQQIQDIQTELLLIRHKINLIFN
ncbi:unnamed protein product [Paramecium sonneborni]|uniref:Uncharacterized protein n=1 Tax=Paramecium sonneborni TaxID=65129 RepID=A0A8S1RDS8_9CILI|nr:unnamed protein product [Paramecium sonneborni]